MNKRMALIAGAVGIGLALSGCSGSTSGAASEEESAPVASAPSSSEASASPEQEASTASATSGGVIAYSYGNEAAGEYATIRDLASKAAEQRGFTLIEGAAFGDCSKQVQDVENFVAQQVSAIVVLPLCGPDPLKPALTSAEEAGIVVVGYSQAVPGGKASIEYDNVAGAEELASFAVDWYKTDFTGDPDDFSWVLYTYDQCGKPCTDRTDPIREIVTAGTGVAPYEAEAVTEEQGLTEIEKLLQKDPGIDMVIGINDAGALGAYQAMAQLVRDGATEGSALFVAGMDGQTEAVKLVAEGGGEGGIYRATSALLLSDLAPAIANVPIDILEGGGGGPILLPYVLLTTDDPAAAQAVLDAKG